jgi:hypothetical protein
MLSAQFVKTFTVVVTTSVVSPLSSLDEQATIVIKAVKNINSFFMLTYFFVKKMYLSVFILNFYCSSLCNCEPNFVAIWAI